MNTNYIAERERCTFANSVPTTAGRCVPAKRRKVAYGGRVWGAVYTFMCQLAILSALAAFIFGAFAVALMSYYWLIENAISR